MDPKLTNWLKDGSLIAASNTNPILSEHNLSRALIALHSDLDWICMEACYALIRHMGSHLEPTIVASVEQLYARAKDNVPIITNLILALMSLPSAIILANKGLARIAYEGATNADAGARVNAAAVIKRLAAENDIHSQDMIRNLLEDIDESVRTNARLDP